MIRLGATFSLTLLLLTGCSSGASTATLDGEAIYNKSCSTCHGAELQGAIGPTLVSIKSKYAEVDVLKLINEGSNRMPGHLVSEKEAEIVTKWLLKK